MLTLILLSNLNTGVSQTVITFDSLKIDEMELLTEPINGVTFTGAVLGLPGKPLTGFQSDDGAVIDITPQPEFSGPFITDPVVDGDTLVAGTIEITFDVEVSEVSFWIADIAEVGEVLTVNGFGINGEFLGTEIVTTTSPDTGNGIATRVELPWEDISALFVRVEATEMGFEGLSGWGLDSLSFVREATNLTGDVNCDGVVDLLDVAPFVDILTNGTFNVKADINQDGAVDLLDVAPFVELLSGG